MNPFNPQAAYDGYLAAIISKINRSTSASLAAAIKELKAYLPKSNYHSDYTIILKSIQPHFESSERETVNKIIYFLAKKLGKECLSSVQTAWIYANIDSDSPSSIKLINECFDLSQAADDFERSLKFDNPLKDLRCFKLLIEHSSEEHYFNVSKVPLQTYFELDLLYEILLILKQRYPLQLTDREGAGDSKPARIFNEVFERISTISNEVLLDRKYKILLEIYNHFDDKAYSESANLSLERLTALIAAGAVPDRLALGTVDQLIAVIPKVSDKEAFLLENINDSMCIFALMEVCDISESLIVKSPEKLRGAAAQTVSKHYITRECRCHSKASQIPAMLSRIYPLLSGKCKIIAASVLGMELGLDGFEVQEIDEVMEHSVNVFPKDFFFTHKFTSTALHFFRKYPESLNELLETGEITKFVAHFASTKPEHIVRHISDVKLLTSYLSDLNKDEIRQLCCLNTSPALKIVYLFYLRDSIEYFEVDYSVVFDSFLQLDFLIYLLQKGNNIYSFIETTVAYIRQIPFNNCALYNEYNFDTDPQFYYNLGLPVRDPVLKLIHTALSSVRLDLKLEFIWQVIKVILHYPVVLSEKLKRHLRGADEEAKLRGLFDLGDKAFVVDRLMLEKSTLNGQTGKASLKTLEINRQKARDVLLRTVSVPLPYLAHLSSSYLSDKALGIVISTICSVIPENISSADPSTELPADELSALTKSLKLDSSDNLIEKFFIRSDCHELESFDYLLEADEIAYLPEFRSERLAIYEPYLRALAKRYSEVFINMYSISKLENTDENAVVELILQPLAHLKRSFWTVVSRILFVTNNIYIAFFIEKMLIRYLDSTTPNFLKTNGIMPVQDYIGLCSDAELSYLAFAFPNMYCKLNIKKPLPLEDIIKASIDRKIDNGKVTYSATGGIYKLKFQYRADSLVHEANITVPAGFPHKNARIEFDGSMKNMKFYHQLNEILSRTSKFVDIFMIWKIDIDNHLMGYNECLICYFIMEPKYRTLPEFKCEVCSNSFHKKCIYKWAAESKRPLCPFCRSELPLWE